MDRIEKRSPFIESRRKTDCFPDGGAVVLAIGVFALVALAIGFALGRWVF